MLVVWYHKLMGQWMEKGINFSLNFTAQESNVKRTAKWSVTFDHKSKGFDNNNSQKFT